MNWNGNEPDYFTKYNDLIYYANGSPDTKRFFEHLPEVPQMEIYQPFAINPTAFLKYGENIVTPYPQPYPDPHKLKYRSIFDVERKKLLPKPEKEIIISEIKAAKKENQEKLTEEKKNK
jgi:hypothetical protein